MAPAATLADIELEVNTARFVEIVWDGPRFYQSFLVERMKERDVVVTAWELSAAKGPSSSSLSPSLSSSKMYSRVITSLHPLPVKLPWLPEAVRSELTQTLEYNHATHVLRITEVSKVHGLPFVDPCIITEWDVVDLSPTSCTCHVTLRFAYEKRSWIEGMVESNSHTELLHFYEEWRAHAAVAFAALDAGDALHTYVGLKVLHPLTLTLSRLSPTAPCLTSLISTAPPFQHLPDLLPDPSSLHVGFTPVTEGSPDSKSPRLARARSSSFALMHVSPLGSPAPAPSSAASTRPRQSSLRGPAPAASVDNLRLMGRPPSPSLSLPIGGGVDDAVSMAQVRRLLDPGPSFTWRTLVKVAYDGVHRHGLLKVVTSALIDAYVQVDNVGFGSQQQVSSGVGAVAGVGTCPLGGYEGDTCAAPGAVADGPPAGLWPWRGVHVGPRAPRPWVDHATSAALVYLLIVAVEVLVCAAWAAASPAVISQPATGFVTVSRATQTEVKQTHLAWVWGGFHAR